jgi:hypothetical protein
MKLLTAFRSEILKTKRTASFYFTLIGAAAVPLIFFINMLTDDDGIDATRKDPLNGIFKIDTEMNGLVFFPVFVILVCTLLAQIEYKNNTWKQVFASPHSKLNVFIAKFINIQMLILLFLVANVIFMFIVLVLTNWIDPKLGLFSKPLNWSLLLLRLANSYLLILALSAFQFWLGLRFKNFILSVGLGFALWLTCIIMALEYHSTIVEYIPHSFQLFSVVPPLQPKLEQVVWTSLGYAIVFLVLGFIDFRRRRLTT